MGTNWEVLVPTCVGLRQLVSSNEMAIVDSQQNEIIPSLRQLLSQILEDLCRKRKNLLNAGSLGTRKLCYQDPVTLQRPGINFRFFFEVPWFNFMRSSYFEFHSRICFGSTSNSLAVFEMFLLIAEHLNATS